MRIASTTDNIMTILIQTGINVNVHVMNVAVNVNSLNKTDAIVIVATEENVVSSTSLNAANNKKVVKNLTTQIHNSN